MAFGVNSIMNMGKGALFASQAAIQTTGDNISNVNTPGYSRRAVLLKENYSIDYNPGQVGQGVRAQEIFRYFDRFVESAYLQKLGSQKQSETLYSQLRYVENLFNEANVDGIGTALTAMFDSWNKLLKEPNSLPVREDLLATAKTLTSTVRNTDVALRDLEEQMDELIRVDVAEANRLIQEIAALNKSIATHYVAGQNNPNTLMDERDARVRDLAAIIDIDVQDRGPGDYRVTMANGFPLVQNNEAFSLDFRGPSVVNSLKADSDYWDRTDPANPKQKTVHFSGKDSFEYTLEIVADGDIGSPPTSATQFRVSMDGGKTWLKDEYGNEKLFNANPEDQSVRVGELEIWFDAGDVKAGDSFTISPKSDVYWISPTVGPLNVSTMVYSDGTKNDLRITGGSLGGYLEFRDYKVGEYRDRLQAFMQSITWEVNRLHSQGAGLTPMTSMLGTYSVGRTDAALGTPESLFLWSDKLTAGNMSFAIYDATTGKPVSQYPGLNVFSGINFDPATHSLDDVVAAINSATFNDVDGNPTGITPFTAVVFDGKLQLSIDPAYSFAMTGDTTGLAAALGLNTFFTGESPTSFAVRDELTTNLNHINSGRLDGAGEINAGDNYTADMIAALASKSVDISTFWNANTRQSLPDYYATIVARIGADTATAKYTTATETAVATDLYNRQEEIGGVNLDEEMTNLIKFQASYKAAAKLITTADEMIQTLLSLKQ